MSISALIAGNKAATIDLLKSMGDGELANVEATLVTIPVSTAMCETVLSIVKAGGVVAGTTTPAQLRDAAREALVLVQTERKTRG